MRSRKQRPGGMADLLAIAFVAVRTRKLRTALSAIGIAIGIASMVAVLGISESSRAGLLDTLDRLGTNLLTVSPGQSFFGEDSVLPQKAPAMVRRIGPVQSVSSTADVEATVRRTRFIPDVETNGIRVRAVDVHLPATLGASLSSGRFLNKATARYPAVVLGSVAAQRLGLSTLSGKARVWMANRWFTVVGILHPMPLAPELDRAALVGRPAARRYLAASVETSILYVRANPEHVTSVRAVLAATANPAHPEEVEVSRPSDVLEARAAAKTAFTTLLLALGAVALVVSAIGIANVMVISVLERRTEIGLRRALGATRRAIRLQFLAEAALSSGIGGALGALLGAGATLAYALRQGWTFAMPVWILVAAVAVAMIVGVVAGLHPALRAARLSPTDALRSA